jgi:ubiquinone/menaquinone biosynthesis C-methylase UbiE
MASHKGFNLDENTRRSWYNPEAILDAVGLKEGMTFVDVGCANGFFSILAAKVVGAMGRVYAVDVNPDAIDKLMQNAQEENLNNITAKAAAAEETVFCKECADIVFFSMSLHDFADPAKVLQNAREMIKPEGKLVNLDWKKQEMPFGPPEHIRFNEAKVTELLEDAGFTVESIAIGRYHYVVTGKPM